jgi:hypothetical protein
MFGRRRCIVQKIPASNFSNGCESSFQILVNLSLSNFLEKVQPFVLILFFDKNAYDRVLIDQIPITLRFSLQWIRRYIDSTFFLCFLLLEALNGVKTLFVSDINLFLEK